MCCEVFHEYIDGVEYLIELYEGGYKCVSYEEGCWRSSDIPEFLAEKYTEIHNSVFGRYNKDILIS
jgi:hypothetical protein